MAAKTVRIYEEDWTVIAELQAQRARRTGERPSYADIIHEAIERLVRGE